MPNNGRIIEWDAIEFKIESVGSHSGSGPGTLGYSHNGRGETGFAPDAIDTALGILLTAESSYDGSVGSWQVLYDGPGAPFGGYTQGGSFYLSTVSIGAIARNVKLYCKLTGSLWRLVWDQVDIYVNGAFALTLSGSGVDVTSSGTGPNYIPLIGVPLKMSGGGVAYKTGVTFPGYDPCDPGANLPFEYSARMDWATSGGWRCQVGGEWEQFPVSKYALDAPTGAGCVLGAGLGSVNADTTWTSGVSGTSYSRSKKSYVGRDIGSFDVYKICPDGDTFTETFVGNFAGQCNDPCGPGLTDVFRDVYATESWGETASGTIRLYPNLEKAIVKHSDDYCAMWFRGRLPEIKGSVTRNCMDGAITSSNTNEGTPYPYEDYLLQVVRNATAPIEDAINLPTYAPIRESAGKSYSKIFTTEHISECLCPPQPIGNCAGGIASGARCDLIWPVTHVDISQAEGVTYIFPSAVSGATDETHGGYQWHADDEYRYLGTWPNIHWQYAFWFEDWEVDGDSSSSASAYWKPIREQWCHNTPGDINDNTRQHMILSPIENEQGNTPFLDSFLGGLRWIGVHRFQTQSRQVEESFALSSEKPGKWTVRDTDATIAIGSSITVNGFTVSEAWVDLNFGDWDEKPYLHLYLAKTLSLNWSWNSGAGTVQVVLIGLDDSETMLMDTPSTKPIPIGSQTKYAGSWAFDHGNGFVTDQGTDSDVSGISSVVVGDSESVFSFQLAKGRVYKAIRFKITPDNPTDELNIDFPSFTMHSEYPAVFWENGRSASWLWENGPGLRWGNWLSYDPVLGFQYPPLTTGLPGCQSIIDWLVFRRVVFDGDDAGSGIATSITTELTSLFDAYEGQSISVVDKFSMSVPLPQTMASAEALATTESTKFHVALINSFSEVPPMACFPFRKRNVEWLPVGNFAQVVHDWTQETRLLVSTATKPARLTDASNVNVGASGTAPSSWYVWKFKPAVDNTEDGYLIKSGSGTYATVRPWHGWFSVLWREDEITVNAIRICADRHLGFLHTVIPTDLGVNLWSWNQNQETERNQVVTTDASSCASVAWSVESRKLVVVYTRDDGGTLNVYRTESNSQGRSWSIPELLWTGRGCGNGFDAYGREYIPYWDSGEFKIQIKRTPDEAWMGPFTIVASDEGVAHVEQAPNANGEIVVVTCIVSGGTPELHRYKSTSMGRTWVET